MLKRFLRSARVQHAMAWIIAAYLKLAYGTTRWTIHGMEHLRPHLGGGASCVVAFWHECLPLTTPLVTEARRIAPETRSNCLVSQHRDGRLIGEVMRHFRIGVVHGSTSRGGAAALRGVIGVLRAGEFISVTPDGPRGPRRKAALGVAQMAALAGVRVLPIGAQTSRRITVNSWDRMVLPLPFGRAHIVVEPTLAVERGTIEQALPDIEAALTRAIDRADELCRR